MKNLTIYIFLILASTSGVFAQINTGDSLTLVHRPIQMGFFPPMSTNGWESGRCVNNISINLFAGYQGGVEGLEVGAFSNIIKHHMKGAQFAGFSNTVLGTTHGAQFAGFANVNNGYTFGGQFSGFANVVTDSVDAFQAAGFTNFNSGRTNGTQVAGYANLVTSDVQGAQIGGFANGTIGNMNGFQAAGFGNVATGDVKGVQVAGFGNVARNITGSQISGFINVAKKVNGLQLGFINISDSIGEGIAIGFLSISRNGYYAIEAEVNETEYALAHLKIGTEKFYNTFSFGMRPQDNKMNWAYGYGVGTLVPLNEKMDLSIDLQSIQLVEGGWAWNDPNLNLHNRLKLAASYNFTDRISVVAGPSFNVLVSDQEDENGNIVGSDLAPWTLTDQTYQHANVKTYLGFNAGVRIQL